MAMWCLFHPHAHINGRDGTREATAPLAGGVEGGCPPLRHVSVFVNIYMQNWHDLQ